MIIIITITIILLILNGQILDFKMIILVRREEFQFQTQ